MDKKRNALISVTDKTGVVEFAQALAEAGVVIYSTGGTAKLLQENNVPVTNISDLTEFPEIMNGRVKTLHPKVFGGILAKRNKKEHLQEAELHEIPLFDFIIVNLYRFAETVSQTGVTLDKALENIDIGGVTLIRAAAKNHQDVAIITSPVQYAEVLAELKSNKFVLSLATKKKLGVAAFGVTANYDAQIFNYLSETINGQDDFAEFYIQPYKKKDVLRYGENPHQRAAVYESSAGCKTGLLTATQIQGKALSYNNYMDGDAAWLITRSFDDPTVAVIKHANPCGVASDSTLVNAYRRALATDNVSAFGGIVSLNREVDADTAGEISKIFTEVIIAPGYSKGALEIFAEKKNLRLLEMENFHGDPQKVFETRCIDGGILVQDKDLNLDDSTKFEVVSVRKPDQNEWKNLIFGWNIVRWVKSNAVIYVKDQQTIGIGAGQMSRVDSSRIAVEKAGIAGLDLKGSAVASDAFFPFADGVEAAAKAGAVSVIQPGGSIRDEEVIAAANKFGMAMVFTKTRHFRH
ncbi:MAG: bifunctional phosphoribosylaminoimidazolecarboxamide formyltransferase/IMP cyclohydrolase [Deferribacteres bacterium]|nr:bifunctional phosphoribosylaminoimidazolecarboxamide formyltransferase/IMP cyclohydrolase [candidate division KSB1 bacterium]MCB9503335.1 bifunctional phosphoribosylaminoimidazolecarboxamide formyltransferase/IMP cyclohydrolase [Deferribacteres bacterium]